MTEYHIMVYPDGKEYLCLCDINEEHTIDDEGNNIKLPTNETEED